MAAEFRATDKNKTGELGFGEFTSLLKSRVPMDENGYRHLFAQMDSDKSGTVSFAELATSLSVIGKGTVEEKLAFTFDLYDADKVIFRHFAQVLGVSFVLGGIWIGRGGLMLFLFSPPSLSRLVSLAFWTVQRLPMCLTR